MKRGLRRSVSLLEVLIAAVLAAGLFSVLWRSWVQMEASALASHLAAEAVTSDGLMRLWLQDHLTGLVKRGDRDVLAWDGECLQATCIHGTHIDARLAGPVRLELRIREGTLVATLASDEELWGSSPLVEEKALWRNVQSMQLSVFGQYQQEQTCSWHIGPQTWSEIPLLAELLIGTSQGEIAIPLFIGGED